MVAVVLHGMGKFMAAVYMNSCIISGMYVCMYVCICVRVFSILSCYDMVLRVADLLEDIIASSLGTVLCPHTFAHVCPPLPHYPLPPLLGFTDALALHFIETFRYIALRTCFSLSGTYLHIFFFMKHR